MTRLCCHLPSTPRFGLASKQHTASLHPLLPQTVLACHPDEQKPKDTTTVKVKVVAWSMHGTMVAWGTSHSKIPATYLYPNK